MAWIQANLSLVFGILAILLAVALVYLRGKEAQMAAVRKVLDALLDFAKGELASVTEIEVSAAALRLYESTLVGRYVKTFWSEQGFCRICWGAWQKLVAQLVETRQVTKGLRTFNPREMRIARLIGGWKGDRP